MTKIRAQNLGPHDTILVARNAPGGTISTELCMIRKGSSSWGKSSKWPNFKAFLSVVFSPQRAWSNIFNLIFLFLKQKLHEMVRIEKGI